MSLDKSVTHLAEQSRRQKAECDARGVAGPRGAKIRARPDEIVGFADDDPRAIAVQAQASSGQLWNLNCILRGGWRRVGDGQNTNALSVGLVEDHENDRARSVLHSFFAPFGGLGSPKVRVTDD